ncbi:SDR family oxidoreductase [Streptomyces sp. NA02950]|uniref:SDR family NAD(P)-dependent oxidoreductase n=1 Tax=Streptomyces sp. NA02950 TaxID=2742137 RepID=UPI001591265E|nr:SDR family NAD(P)-dependent oxidoreductase [Streptomyces sp. NA02950]QKV93058.1 SDR family oxidoreductase [Streptomyces sp. NA02950]
MTRLAGRKAVVTGGTKGLGRAITQAFIREGCDVVAAARNADHLQREMSFGPGKYLFHPVNVQNRASVATLMEYADLHLGGLDIVVANAGVSRPGSADTLPEEAWDEVIDTNLTGVFRCVQAAVPYLERSEHARLITMSSVLAGQVTPGASAYSSSKAAVEAFTRVCAAELAPRNITVNCLSPGLIDAGMGSLLPRNEKMWPHYEAKLAMGRMGRPEEVADAAVFLASADSRYVNGHVLEVSGGLWW